jgi:hypothetical protein
VSAVNDMERLIEWDSLEVRVSGEKLAAMAKPFAIPPLERLELRFTNGLLRVEGTIRKWIPVPFTVDIPHIAASGTTVRVPLRNAQAFNGLIPIPQFLFSVFRDKLPNIVGFEEPATLVVCLDRFLPPFIHAEIQKIWIIDGGLSVTLGRGGANLPPSSEETHGRDHHNG